MADNHSAPETPNDDGVSQLKKRARRRLVGAVALALLAAIVLPMVMDHEPKPATQDIQVRIPSQDAGNFTSRLTPKPAPTPLPVAPMALSAPMPASPVAPVAAVEPAKTDVKPEAKPEIKAESKPEAKKVETKPEHKPETKPADTKASEAARAEKLLNGGHSNEQFILQLGAYQESGNVKVLQAKVKELGYSSYTEKVDTPSGPRIRVRAGPFKSREQALKAQAQLKKINAGGPPGGVLATK